MTSKEETSTATNGFKWMVRIASGGLLALLITALLANIYFVYLMLVSEPLGVANISSATLLEVVATVAAVLTVITVVFSFIMLVRAQEARVAVESVREHVKDGIALFEERLAGYNAPQLRALADYVRAHAAFQRSDYGSSVFYLDQAITNNDNFWEAYILRGEAWYYLENYDNAIKNYDKVITNTVNDAIPYRLKGEAYLKLGKKSEALQCFREALNRTRNDKRAIDGLNEAEKLPG
jgi:tetratricopeptide (TPR) repeat protein